MIIYFSIGFIFWLISLLCGRIHCPALYEHGITLIVMTVFWPVLLTAVALKFIGVTKND
jgi:hypothetical protein